MKLICDRRLLKTLPRIESLAVTSILTMNLGASGAPVITSVATPGCNIKGSISVATGRKLYHLPGMRNYAATSLSH